MSLVQQGDFNRAVPLLRQILDQLPKDLKARNLYGITLSAIGRREEANEEFAKVLALDPTFVPALKNLAVNELAMGQKSKAKFHFEQALRFAPLDATCHWGAAEIAFAERNFRDAALHYGQSGDLVFKDPRVTIRFATSYLEVERSETSRAKALALIETIPTDADANIQFQAGLILARLENFAAAARRLELARNGFPDAYQLGYNLTLVLLGNREYSAAIKTAEETLAAGFKKAELYNLLAQAYDKAGKKKEAYDALRVATELEPQDETNYLDLISLLMQSQNYDLSLEIAEAGLRRVPHSHRLHLQRGAVLAMKGRYEDAVKEFQTSSQLTPEAGLPQVALGLVLMQMGKTAEAIEVLRRQSVKTPNDSDVFWFLGEALNQSGLTVGSKAETEAIAALKKSIQLDPSRSQPRALLGKILLGRGEVAEAAAELEKAVEIDPQDLTATYLLARALQKKGDTARAMILFDKVGKAKTEEVESTKRNLLRIMKTGP